MLSPKDLDHNLLFKKLVILEEDNKPIDEISEKSQKEDNTVTDVRSEQIPEETVAPVIEQEEQDPALEIIATTEETKAEPQTTTLQGSAVIICRSDIKDTLLATGSNLNKIISALKLSVFTEHLYSTNELTEDTVFSDQEFIWTIGLNENEIKGLFKETKAHIIHSPNMEAPMDTAEKVSMYEPLKEFATKFHQR